MKRIFAFIIGACFACALIGVTVASAQPFEGVINTVTTVNGQKFEATEYVKGLQTRSEMSMNGQQIVNLTDMAGKTVSTMMPARKMCMVMSIPDAKAVQADPAAKPVKTGKSETILGYTCDEWVSTNSKTKQIVDMWLAKGTGMNMEGMGGQMDRYLSQSASDFAPMFKDGAYPLRTILKDESGKETMRQEVTKIEKKPVDASLFVVPADYKKMPMPAGMGQKSDK